MVGRRRGRRPGATACRQHTKEGRRVSSANHGAAYLGGHLLFPLDIARTHRIARPRVLLSQRRRSRRLLLSQHHRIRLGRLPPSPNPTSPCTSRRGSPVPDVSVTTSAGAVQRQRAGGAAECRCPRPCRLPAFRTRPGSGHDDLMGRALRTCGMAGEFLVRVFTKREVRQLSPHTGRPWTTVRHL